MTKRLYYGFEGQEILVASPDEVIENMLDSEFDPRSGLADFDRWADEIDWPLVVHEHQPVAVQWIRWNGEVLYRLLESLDENYGSLEEATEPTKAMQEAEQAFLRVMEAEYRPWRCEPTGETVRFSREQVRAMFHDNEGGDS